MVITRNVKNPNWLMVNEGTYPSLEILLPILLDGEGSSIEGSSIGVNWLMVNEGTYPSLEILLPILLDGEGSSMKGHPLA